MTNWSAALRAELAHSARQFAVVSGVPHYLSLGAEPTVMFEAAADGCSHGNFQTDSYLAIQGRTDWADRLRKAHPRQNALPSRPTAEPKELDSSNSSDALLMNCFCYPDAADRIFAALLPGWPVGSPQFGIDGLVPFSAGGADETEIDMQAGKVLFEGKLTERDFTSKATAQVERYRDFETVFEKARLPETEGSYDGYQLIRNVLAAAAHDGLFVLICDARRPDLLHAWWQVFGAIRRSEDRQRCGFLLWQEIAVHCPKPLREFLSVRYGL